MFPIKIENDSYTKFGGKEVCYGNVEEVNREKNPSDIYTREI